MNKEILNLFAETGLLKRVKRTGWWVIGIKDPESVAEHSFRCAVIGYVLAKMEKAQVHSATMMCLFNDLHEARTNDHHKMNIRYIDHKKAEDKAFKEQVQSLPKGLKDEMWGWRTEYTGQKTKESLIARDADILECLIQAKEYLDQGVPQAKLFFQKAPKFLKTKSAKALWKSLQKWDSSKWWQKVCEFER
ncbi:MAG: HD domain-containing protein [PVC group bacterium]|nr:HD domain-containing protein [PVC group bacterium]